MSSSLERALVGLCLNSKHDLNEALSLGVEAKHFDDPLCREIFAVMHGQALSGKDVDLASVGVEMKDKAVQVVKLATDDTPSSGSVKLYAEAAIDKARDRLVLQALSDSASRIRHKLKHDIWADPTKTDAAMEALFTAMTAAANASQVKTAEMIFQEMEATWEEEYRNPETRKRIKLGIKPVDKFMGGGLRKGMILTVGAATGRGKSLFSINAAVGAAFAGAHVLYATEEMKADEIYERIISDRGNALYERIVSESRGEEEFDAFHRVRKMFHGIHLDVCDTAFGDIKHIERIVRHAAKVKPYDLIVLDYIQQYKFINHPNPAERMRELAKFLKNEIANKLGVAIIAPAQMNRMAESEGMDGLRTSNIADSAAIERYSDFVAFLAHENPKSPSEEALELGHDAKNLCWFKVGKNRRGPGGISIPLRFNPEFARFEEI